MAIKIRAEVAKAKKKLARMEKKVQQELANAINVVARKSKASIAKKLSIESGAKTKNIRKLIPIKRADGRSKRKLFAVLTIIGKTLATLALSTKVKKSGAGLSFKRAKQARFLKGAFVAKLKSGHMGIYTREKGAGRLPISEQRVKSNPDVFIDDGVGKKEEKKNSVLLKADFLKRVRKIESKFNSRLN